jgi:uncharacterized protein
LKLLVAEAGSSDAGALWDAADAVITSTLSYAETRAALAAARRSRRLSMRGFSDAKEALEARFHEFHIVGASWGIMRSAGDLAELHALGYDAVHLASVLALKARTLCSPRGIGSSPAQAARWGSTLPGSDSINRWFAREKLGSGVAPQAFAGQKPGPRPRPLGALIGDPFSSSAYSVEVAGRYRRLDLPSLD